MVEEDTTVETVSNEQILKKLDQIDKAVKDTQTSVKKIKQYMFWRLMVLAFVIVVPLVVLPFVLMNFIDTYLASFEGLL